MKGLILKDLLSISRELKIMAVLCVFAAIFSSAIGFSSGIFMVAFVTGTLSITSFAYDDASNWNRTALSMPLNRSDIVISKYITHILLVFTALTATACLFCLLSITGIWSYDPVDILLYSGVALFITIAFFSILIPMIYKFGAERARILIVMIGVVPIIILMLIKDYIPPLTAIDESLLERVLPILLPLISIMLFIISMLISIAIFKRKEI